MGAKPGTPGTWRARHQYEPGEAATDGRVPVLWLYGTPGSGKTAVGWEIFSRLSADGVAIGYVDVDQLGICYPAPRSDPDRYQMKARNVDLVVTTFGAAGAGCVVVSGVVDVNDGLDLEQLPHARVTPCRLRAEPGELRRRLLERGASPEYVAAVLRESVAVDADPPAGVCVDTTELTVPEVADVVCGRFGGPTTWASAAPGQGQPSKRWPEGAPPRVPVLLICGPTAVGKSVVGWQLYERARRAGLHTAFVDLGQLGFLRPSRPADPGNHQVRARNLAALWGTFAAAGAECLVVVGRVDDEASASLYRRALSESEVVLCRLHAQPATLAERVRLRGQGRNWSEPGDRLRGQTTACLSTIAVEAAQEAQDMEDNGLGDVRVDTEGLSVEGVAEAVVAATGG